LSIVAKKIGLNKQLFISKWEEKNNGREKASITSDALESLIWYLALDIWYNVAENFVLKYVYAEIDNLSISVKSYKTVAQEKIQKIYKKIPIYRDKEEEYDDKHNVIRFCSEIIVNDSIVAVWYWTNKKKAQEDAAKNYCESLTSSWK
jgi:ribonuclease-3